MTAGNFFPPGLSVRAVTPSDNESVRSLFIAGQSELVSSDTPIDLRIAVKKYTDSALNNDLSRASVHYSKPKRQMWVLESQQKVIVAMIAVDSVAERPSIATLCRLVVSSEFRRKGVARLLSLRAEQWAQKQGFEIIRLETTELHPPAIALYESLGYVKAGQLKYGPISVVEMEKQLA